MLLRLILQMIGLSPSPISEGSSRMSRLPQLGCLLLVGLTGFFFLLAAAIWYVRGALLQSEGKRSVWTPIEAVCVGHEARRLEVISVGTGSRGSEVFVPLVVFHYFPAGVKTPIEGRATLASDEFASSEEALASAKAFIAKGKVTRVFYDPNSPGEISLHPGGNQTNTGPVLAVAFSIALILGLCSLAAVFVWFRWWSKRELVEGSIFDVISVLSAVEAGAFCLLLGGALVVGTFNTLWQARNSSDWLVTEGVVLQSKWERGNSEKDRSYSPKIRYRFEAGGTRESEQIFFGWGTRSYDTQAEVERFLSRYKVGAKVNVYYDPANPKRSVLLRERPGYEWALILGGLIMSLAGTLLMMSGVRGFRSRIKTVPKADTVRVMPI